MRGESPIEIAMADVRDLEPLQVVARVTFAETFAADNTEADMRKYLDSAFSLERLNAELKDPDTVFYLARSGEEVIGYLKLNFGSSQTEIQDEDAIEIERIYVMQAWQGKQVGKLLFDQAFRIARKRQAQYLWLGVWEKNLNAIAFYRKLGFFEFGHHLFRLGDDEQTDILMKLPLQETAT